jgi:hypothetical protein
MPSATEEAEGEEYVRVPRSELLNWREEIRELRKATSKRE